jgi:mono/diheme cytochrome c family protein
MPIQDTPKVCIHLAVGTRTNMRTERWMLYTGLALILVGVAGILVGVALSPSITPSGVRLSGTDTSLGARIFLDGLGEDGMIPRTATGPGMMGGGCVTCHGIDGRGGTFSMMMGSFDAPDVTYDTLTGEHANEGEHAEDAGWTDDDIRRSIEDGVKPDGERLDPFMPRWQLSDAEFDALLEHLKELSE